MTHLSTQQLEALVGNQLDAAARAPMLEHVGSCESCSALVAFVLSAAPSDTSSARLRKGDRIGRWVVVERLGSGAMGTVFKAFDPVLDRHVAVKVLHGHIDEVQRRVLQEARSLARLSHTNVVQLHEVSAESFLVMELIEGETLEAFFKTVPRWPLVLDRCLEAGRGLAAAHAQNVLHGDFKPSNVLIGRDHRVCVADFGLGRSLHQPLEQVTTGTLAYMAPERIRGEPLDARADQFSFCVSLYEGLCRTRPFLGSTAAALLERIAAGPAPSTGKHPAALHKIIVRGLHADPARRWPSMNALLQALNAQRFARQRSVAWASGAIAVLVAGASIGVLTTRSPCHGHETALDDVWNVGVKSALREGLTKSGLPWADDALGSLEHRFDAYAASWRSMHEQACRATRVEQHQSEDVLTLRMACLDQAHSALGAQVGLLTHADRATASRSSEIVASLPELAHCADIAALSMPVPLPKDANARGEIASVLRGLAEVRALRASEQLVAAQRLAVSLEARAEAAQFAPLSAQAAFEVGELERLLGANVDAEKHLSRAVSDAEAGASLETLAEAADSLSLVLNRKPAGLPEALRWSQLAGSALGRVRVAPAQNVNHLLARATLEAARGEKTLSLLEAASALAKASFEPSHPLVFATQRELAFEQSELGDAEVGAVLAQGLVDSAAHDFGPRHPRYGKALLARAAANQALEHFGDALADARAARTVFSNWFGAKSALLARAFDAEGMAHAGLKEPKDAEASFRAALETEVEPFETRDTLAYRAHLGSSMGQQGRFAEAQAILSEGIELFHSLGQDDNQLVAAMTFNLAQCLKFLDRLDEALSVQQRLVRVYEGLGGPQSLDVADTLRAEAVTLLEMKRFDEALPVLNRSLAISQAIGDVSEGSYRTRFFLAQVLWEKGRERQRAIELAKEARDGLAAMPGQNKIDFLGRVKTWLLTNAGAESR